jgi:hypothetical protein
MEILQWVFYIFLGFLAFGIAMYFVFSPFALIVGLFSPHAVLDNKKPQTRFRVLKRYGITTSILALIGFGALSSVPAEESVYAATTYSTPSITTASNSTPVVQESASYSKSDETKAWVNVRGDRAVQVVGIKTVDRIAPDNEFAAPVEGKGGQLVVVGMKLKNTGQESGDMMWTDFKLIDRQGRKYDELDDFSEMTSINMWLEEQGGDKASSQMFPGATIETAKVFPVAPDASGF